MARLSQALIRDFFIITSIALTLSACANAVTEPLETPRPKHLTDKEIRFATQILNDAQQPSFVYNREYCGFIGLDKNGNFMASPPRKGKKSSCMLDEDHDISTVLASYHTHGAYSHRHESEIPSFDDLAGDIEDGVDGYIATPGGRLWYSDARAGEVRLLCESCILTDPDFEPDVFEILSHYKLEELE